MVLKRLLLREPASRSIPTHDDRAVDLDTPTAVFLVQAQATSAPRWSARRVDAAHARLARPHRARGASDQRPRVSLRQRRRADRQHRRERYARFDRTSNGGCRDDEAEVVRRMLQMCADGVRLKRIAATLNAEGARSRVISRAGQAASSSDAASSTGVSRGSWSNSHAETRSVGKKRNKPARGRVAACRSFAPHRR